VTKPQVRPQRWTPPAPLGLDGPYAKNNDLAAAEVLPVPGEGPEDVVVADDGTVYTGTADGALLALSASGQTVRSLTNTGGRPLGIELLADGRLLVCDADCGLLAVDPSSGAVETLVAAVAGERLVCTNNAAVASDGVIWFTDSSRRFPVHHYKGDLVEHSGTGRLFRRDTNGAVETVLDGLHFPNGVALDPQGRFLLVAETGMYRILRLELTGDRQGQTQIFADVPGFPDNLATGPTGTFWCAVASTRNALLDRLSPRAPLFRRLIWSLPDALMPGPERCALVFGFGEDGTVTANLQWHGGPLITATGAREHEGFLYVGSLSSSCLLRYRLP
jgi:sugar lactone lactonase YvrE